MWISKKEWNVLKKRIADLEGQVQGQLKVELDIDTIRKTLKKIERFAPVVNFTFDHQE